MCEETTLLLETVKLFRETVSIMTDLSRELPGKCKDYIWMLFSFRRALEDNRNKSCNQDDCHTVLTAGKYPGNRGDWIKISFQEFLLSPCSCDGNSFIVEACCYFQLPDPQLETLNKGDDLCKRVILPKDGSQYCELFAHIFNHTLRLKRVKNKKIWFNLTSYSCMGPLMTWGRKDLIPLTL